MRSFHIFHILAVLYTRMCLPEQTELNNIPKFKMLIRGVKRRRLPEQFDVSHDYRRVVKSLNAALIGIGSDDAEPWENTDEP